MLLPPLPTRLTWRACLPLTTYHPTLPPPAIAYQPSKFAFTYVTFPVLRLCYVLTCSSCTLDFYLYTPAYLHMAQRCLPLHVIYCVCTSSAVDFVFGCTFGCFWDGCSFIFVYVVRALRCILTWRTFGYTPPYGAAFTSCLPLLQVLWDRNAPADYTHAYPLGLVLPFPMPAYFIMYAFFIHLTALPTCRAFLCCTHFIWIKLRFILVGEERAFFLHSLPATY